jgi:hypothetical protein
VALWLDKELWQGKSDRCETFDNEPLNGPDTHFECVALELLGFALAS